MGVLGNIYCIPNAPGSVPWQALLGALSERSMVRPPYRAGSPFKADADRTDILWPENWIGPHTLRSTSAQLPLCDYPDLEEAVAYVASVPDATITMDCPWSAFQPHPDARELSAALALYRFTVPVTFRVGVPQAGADASDGLLELAHQPTEPGWQGEVSELLWLHGKCVPCKEEFLLSPLWKLLDSLWPGHTLLADQFL
jgi:hypothetical protein